jgi:tetratricopeptide (TPR) repeat protein
MSVWRISVVSAALLTLAVSTGCEDLRARQLLKSGNDYYRKGEYKLAVDSYKQAEAIRPDIVQVHLHQAYAGLSLFVPGDPSPPNQQVAKDCIDAFNRYLKLRPNDEKIRQIMIQTLIDSGRYDDALNFFKAKLEQNPKDLEAIKALGVISSKAGRFDDGLGWYERRTQVTPNDPEAFYAIGTLCWERLYQRSDKAGEERVKLADRGIVALKRAVELKPKYVEAITYVNLLYRERALGQPEESEERAKDLEQARYFHQMALGLRGLATQPASGPASGPASAPAADPKGAKGAKGAKAVKGAKAAEKAGKKGK